MVAVIKHDAKKCYTRGYPWFQVAMFSTFFFGFKLIGMTSKWESSCILESPGRECLSGLNLISINHKVIISNFATRNSFEFISQCHSEHKKTESIAMSFSVLVLFVQCKISFLIKSSGAEMLRAKRHLETKPSESQMSQVTHSNLIGRLTPALDPPHATWTRLSTPCHRAIHFNPSRVVSLFREAHHHLVWIRLAKEREWDG